MLQKVISWYKRPNKSFIADTLESLIVIIPIVFLIKTFVFGLYQVPTCSMEPTMIVGERFFAEKFTIFFQPPKRGDVIAFNNPLYAYSKNPAMNMFERYASWNVVSWTKRVIGIPGDHVQGKIEGGKTAILDYVVEHSIHQRNGTNNHFIELIVPKLYVQKNIVLKIFFIRMSQQIKIFLIFILVIINIGLWVIIAKEAAIADRGVLWMVS